MLRSMLRSRNHKSGNGSLAARDSCNLSAPPRHDTLAVTILLLAPESEWPRLPGLGLESHLRPPLRNNNCSALRRGRFCALKLSPKLWQKFVSAHVVNAMLRRSATVASTPKEWLLKDGGK